MRFVVKKDGVVLGSVLANHSMTDEEICEIAGVEIAKTKEDFDNGLYDITELEITEDQ